MSVNNMDKLCANLARVAPENAPRSAVALRRASESARRPAAQPEPARDARAPARALRHAARGVPLRGAEVYLMLPNGVGRSKLSNAWLDARLGVVSTMRNWRTVTKLAAMVEARRR